MKYPLITLHSGAGGTLPNSRAYLEYAARRADIVEVDLRCTREGRVILHHDSSFFHKGTEHDLSRMTLKEIRELKPDFLTLEEALDYGRKNNFFWNLDMKEPSFADAMLLVLEQTGCEKDVLISGCSQKEVSYLHGKKPGLRVLFNLPEQKLLDINEEKYKKNVEDLVYQGVEAGCCGLNVNYRCCRPFLVRYASLRALPVMVWTIEKVEDLKRFASMGVSSLTMGNPALIDRLRILSH